MRWIQNTLVPQFNHSGLLLSYDGLVADITERKQAELNLKKSNAELQSSNQSLEAYMEQLKASEIEIKTSEERYRTVADFTYDWEYWIGANGNFEYVSPSCERISGYKVCDFIENPGLFESIIHPLDRDFYCDKLCEMLSNFPNGQPYDFRIIRQNGSECWIANVAQPVFNTEGRIMGTRGSYRDVSWRKNAELHQREVDEQLFQADKLISLGTMVAGVAHEINNPNNFIMMNAPMIRDAWSDIAPILEGYSRESGEFSAGGMPYDRLRKTIPELIDGIHDGSRRISAIVKELKDFSRREKDFLSEAVDMNAVIESSVAFLNNVIVRSTKFFKLTCAEQLPGIRGNMRRLQQVMVNLIENACQALPGTDRAVYVSTSYVDNIITIEIKDEGEGIKQENITRIFDPFFTQKHKGTGLGLSISLKIVQEHGGRILVKSKPGEGSTFTVVLPVQ